MKLNRGAENYFIFFKNGMNFFFLVCRFCSLPFLTKDLTIYHFKGPFSIVCSKIKKVEP